MMAWQAAKLMVGGAIALVFAALVVMAVTDGQAGGSLIIPALISCVYVWLWVLDAFRLRTLRKVLSSNQVLVVRYRRPADSGWPDEFSPPVEYLSQTREKWGYYPIQDEPGRPPSDL